MADLLNLANHAAGQPQRQVIYGQLSLKQPAPSSFGSPLYVVIPDWSTDFYFKVPDWVACHGTTLPAQGTDCLLIKDDRANLRCVWWAGVTTSLPTGVAGGYDVVGTYPSQLQVRGILNAAQGSSSPFTQGPSTYTQPFFLPGGQYADGQLRRRYLRNASSDSNPRRLWLFYKSRDTNNWEIGLPVQITVYTQYYQGSYTRSVFTSGFSDAAGGAPTLITVEAAGPKPIAPTLGAEQTASGTIKYSGVYADIPAYAAVIVEVTYGEHEVAGTGNITAGGQVSFDGTELTNTGAGAFFNAANLIPGGTALNVLTSTVARAHRSAALNLTGGATNNKVPVDASDFDVGGNLDVSTNHRYNVPFNGYYEVSGQVAVGAGAIAPAGFPSVFKNGAEASRGQRNTSGTVAGDLFDMSVNDIIQCTAGDYLELYFTLTSGTNVQTLPLEIPGTASRVNYLSVARVA